MEKQSKAEWQIGILAAGVLLGGLWLQSGEGLAAQIIPPPEASGFKSAEVVQQVAEKPDIKVIYTIPKKKIESKGNNLKVAESVVTIHYSTTGGTASDGTVTKDIGKIKNGQTWVPITFLRDTLKMPVSYDAKKKVYTVGEGFHQFIINVENNYSLTLNGYFLNDIKAINDSGKLFVPVRLLKQYLGYEAILNDKDKTVSIKEVKQNDILFKSETRVENKNGVEIDLTWPQVSYSKDIKVEESINQKISDAVHAYEKEIDELVVLKQKDKIDIPYMLSSSYIVTYNQKGIVSLILEQYDFTGGAHGMTYRKAFTFSLKDGKELTVSDVIGNNKNRLNQINNSIKRRFEESNAYLGGFKGIDNKAGFYIEPGNLIVYFQLYDYTPYVAGFPEFLFPLIEIIPNDSKLFD